MERNQLNNTPPTNFILFMGCDSSGASETPGLAADAGEGVAALADLRGALSIQKGEGWIAGAVVVALMAADAMRGRRVFGLPLREKHMEVIVHVLRSGDGAVALQTIIVADRRVERCGLRRVAADPGQQIARAQHQRIDAARHDAAARMTIDAVGLLLLGVPAGQIAWRGRFTLEESVLRLGVARRAE